MVAIDRPDFSNLGQALDCILNHYGWVEEVASPLETRRSRVRELLNQFPAFIVVDDIDSLESENEDVVEFFTLQVPSSGNSKVLLTSRRTIFGMGGSTTLVEGLLLLDGEEFVKSRCRIMGLDEALFKKGTIKEILRATDGSPLYIEDLLRLSASMRSVSDAITAWSGREGSEARKYALGRECELLTESARKVLLGASVPSGAVSFAEIEAITGLSTQTVTSSIQELQKLFLVPKPREVKGEQRFQLNSNTRTLVRELYGSGALFRQLEAAYHAVSQGIPAIGRGRIAGLIRQASFLVRSGRPQESEQLVLSALDKYPNDPD